MVDEIKIPGFNRAYKDQKAKLTDPTQSGVVLVSMYDVFDRPSESQLSEIGFSDANFMLHFYDDKVKAIFIDYSDYEPDSAKEFVNSVSDKLRLPASGWKYRGKYAAALKCKNFTVSVWTGRYEDRPIYKAEAMLSLNDDEADVAELENRRAYLRKQQLEALERKRQELIKKKTFKP
jgi:hypothetical protein